MFSLYRDLYRSEFRFSRREPEKIVRILSEGTMLERVAACFGAFPARGMLHDLEHISDDMFTPEVLLLSPANVDEIFENN